MMMLKSVKFHPDYKNVNAFRLIEMPSQPHHNSSAKRTRFRDLPVRCPCCGELMISTLDFTNKITESILSKSSTTAIKALEEFEDKMRPIEKTCFKKLKNFRQQYPFLTLKKLLQKMMPPHLEKLKQKEFAILDKISELRKNLPESLAVKVKNITVKARKQIEHQDPKNLFKRRLYIAELKTIKEKNKTNETLEQMLLLANKLPTSNDDISAFIVKYSQRSSREIGKRLLSRTIGTKEHIKAHSNKGKNHMYNYLVECAGCNNTRQNLSFELWVIKHPMMLNNLKNYMKDILECLKSGLFKDFDYPKEVVKTIKRETLDNELIKKKPNEKYVRKFENLIYELNYMVKNFYKENKNQQIRA